MHYYEVAPTKIFRAGDNFLTYSSDEPLTAGQIVLVEIGKKQFPAVLFKEVIQPKFATKLITSIIEPTPLPPEILQLASWIGYYYATPIAAVLQTILPSGLIKNRRVKLKRNRDKPLQRTTIILNESQAAAVQKIESTSPGSFLLHGITGSGKTNVYLKLAEQSIADRKSVIVLVPEISLTSQLVAEFSRYFDNILLTHSHQTEAERHVIWQQALDVDTPHIIIGPRSALFLPLRSIGLIVIDEAHEPSFKQEQSPRYSALRAASKLAEYHNAKLVLGSATPQVAEYYLAEHSGRPIITMNHTARPSQKPTIELIDMTKRVGFKQHRFISDKMIVALTETFEAGKQALIFHNRRGSASTTLCENCGWQAGCPRCYVPLTLHADAHLLRCHICDTHMKVPTSCPECGHVDIVHRGIGTKLIESELRKLFPKQIIARFDADSEKHETVDQQYAKLKNGDIDLIVGTQVIAKGLDLPHLRAVGVIQADAGLSLPDYSSPERTFQLLAQVVGRVGRSDHETTVIIQSYQPYHPVIQSGIAQNYQEFYERSLKLRRHTHFPPFVFLLKLTCIYKTEATAIRNAQNLAQTLRTKKLDIEILGPTPAFYERSRDTYRWQLVIKSKQRAELLKTLELVPTQHWQSELDPISLL